MRGFIVCACAYTLVHLNVQDVLRVCMYAHVHVHMRSCACMCAPTTRTKFCAYVYAFVRECVCVCVCIYVRACIRIFMHAYMYLKPCVTSRSAPLIGV
jgi:hypothetical protein